MKEGIVMNRRIKKLGCILLALTMFLMLPVLPASRQSHTAEAAGATYRVVVSEGYLALRTAKAYDSRNEIGKLYTGDLVTIQDSSDSRYWYVYSSKLGKYGYVNKDYLEYYSSGDTASKLVYGVTVSKGYLALRTAKAYDSRNEIGKLYNGDTVEVQDSSDSQYWYVYSSKLGKYGYVNKDYLYYISGSSGSSSDAYTVSVSKGYLALRTAMAYDSRNEIGKLYSGDVVYLKERSGSQYWYVYAPNLNKYGYVNKDYLIGSSSVSYVTKTVRVSKGYLALRTAKAYDSRNEIGKLYTGDTVEVRDSSDSRYWYVYAPSLGKYGYVNKDYLY